MTIPGEATEQCGATCGSHRCHLAAGHSGRHETAPYERLNNGTRRFGTLHPKGWRIGDDLAPDRAEWSRRGRELSRMRKARLIEIVQENNTNLGIGPAVLGGPEHLSKDQLVHDILRYEIPSGRHKITRLRFYLPRSGRIISAVALFITRPILYFNNYFNHKLSAF